MQKQEVQAVANLDQNLKFEIKADERKHDFYVNKLVGDVKANLRDFYRYTNSQQKVTKMFSIPDKEKWKGHCSVGP